MTQADLDRILAEAEIAFHESVHQVVVKCPACVDGKKLGHGTSGQKLINCWACDGRSLRQCDSTASRAHALESFTQFKELILLAKLGLATKNKRKRMSNG